MTASSGFDRSKRPEASRIKLTGQTNKIEMSFFLLHILRDTHHFEVEILPDFISHLF